MYNHKEAIREIIHLLQNQNNHIAYIKRTIRNYVNEGFNINTKYLRGNTLAHYIIKYNVFGLFNFLAKLGLNLDICNDEFDCPIHIAARNNQLQLVKELVNAGANINQSCDLEETALHIAVSESNYEMAALLLKLGIDKSLVDEKNASALDYALDDKNEKMINILKK